MSKYTISSLTSIFFKDLPISGVRLGVYAAEKAAPQTIALDLELRGSFSGEAGSDTDNLAATFVDYTAVVACLTLEAQSQHFNLVETLAHTLLAALFRQFPKISWGRLQVYKYQGLKEGLVSISVEGARERESHAR